METGVPSRLMVKGLCSQKLGKSALLLAMTENKAEEESCKKALVSQGLLCVATEVGGSTDGEYQKKVLKAVIGAALNAGVLEKECRSMHALLHAVEEAQRGVVVNITGVVNLATKVAMVSNKEWLAVALYGESSLHAFSAHERAGLGIMHLP